MPSVDATGDSLELLQQSLPMGEPVTIIYLLRFNERAVHPSDSDHGNAAAGMHIGVIPKRLWCTRYLCPLLSPM
jgi:hypothetical protein